MRVLVAGATGALGVPVVRRLVADGHTVIGLTRTRERIRRVEAAGARGAVADVFDARALGDAVESARPDVVVHALTAIPQRGPLRARDLTVTNSLRITGTSNLLAAAIAAGARRIVVESMVFIYGFGDLGDTPLIEETLPAQVVPRPWLQACIDALVSEERQVLEASRSKRIEGVVLRFGVFYGPGAGTEQLISMVQRRMMPVPARAVSRGIPWIHVGDAASAALAGLSRGRPSQIYNIVDDEPVPFQTVIQQVARDVGAPPPRSVPTWMIRLAAPFAATALLDTTLRVSNAKAKQELGWVPQFPTYREGIAHLLSSITPAGCRE